jgi:hypothetical protein
MRNTAAYLFAEDLHDEGTDRVLDRLQEAGLNGVAMAAAYHHSRDVFPHNPRRKVIFLEGGVVYFHPQFERYASTIIKPHVAAIARDTDPLADLVRAAERRNMRACAWVVFLHNTRLAMEHPECSPVNAFGDRLLNCMCPANPDVRAYACALASDVARYGVHSIAMEALSYMPFDHGYHHERTFVRLSPNIRYLLGLCFCEFCVVAGQAAGLDVERVRESVRAIVEEVFESERAGTHELAVQEAIVRSVAEGLLGRFLEVREEIVSSLTEEVAAAVHAERANTSVLFVDPSGATLGYISGRPSTEALAASIGWYDGVNVPAVASACDGLVLPAYFADLVRFQEEVKAYIDLLPREANLQVVLRPTWPDTASAESLSAKISVLEMLGVYDIAFYHYGFMRLESLEWIRSALN